MRTLALSILDLVSLRPDEQAGDAIARAVRAAQHVEQLGYKRYWLAEHHSNRGLACSATAVLIGHIAQATSTIRVGSGGIMLPNHPPLVVAEQFGTLAAMYPARIDLGLGRAPGTDPATMRALRRDLQTTGDEFPALVAELQMYLGAPREGQMVHAYPGENSQVPITILGSSTFGAQFAAMLGVPFAFAAHFAPQLLNEAMRIYRESFRPSDTLSEPYAMAGVPVVVAETTQEAKRLFTSAQMRFLALVRRQPTLLRPPVDSMDGRWNPIEYAAVHGHLDRAIVGNIHEVERGLRAFVEETDVREIFAVTDTYDFDARLRSYEMLSEIAQRIKT